MWDFLFPDSSQGALAFWKKAFQDLQPQDLTKFVQLGALGFMGFGAYGVLQSLAHRTRFPEAQLVDDTESLTADPVVLKAFVQLQNYRRLSIHLYKSSLMHVDQLLFLEGALRNQDIEPRIDDKAEAFTHFRIAVKRLQEFCFLVKKRLGNEHFVAVQLLVQSIYDQLQKHLENVFYFCGQYDPQRFINKAKKEVKRAMRGLKHNQPIADRRKKLWSQMLHESESEQEPEPEPIHRPQHQPEQKQ